MKHKVGPGSVRGTSRTSAIEATSECVIPPAHRICSRSGDGFAFTAYIERPGNFSTKNRAARAAACGRTSVTGWAGLTLAISMQHVTSRGAVASPSARCCLTNSRDLQGVIPHKVLAEGWTSLRVADERPRGEWREVVK